MKTSTFAKALAEADTEVDAEERTRAMRDSADFKRTGGKKNARMVSEAKDTRLPSLPCTSLDRKEVDLLQLCTGRVSLVAFGFKQSSDTMIEAFRRPFEEAFGADKDAFQFVEVNMCADASWRFGFIRYFMMQHMQKTVPPERHGQYLCHTVGPSTPLQQLEMGGTRLVGYARLVDRQGRVRWLAQGVATKQEITDMIALAHGLSTTQADAASLAGLEKRKVTGVTPSGRVRRS